MCVRSELSLVVIIYFPQETPKSIIRSAMLRERVATNKHLLPYYYFTTHPCLLCSQKNASPLTFLLSKHKFHEDPIFLGFTLEMFFYTRQIIHLTPVLRFFELLPPYLLNTFQTHPPPPPTNLNKALKLPTCLSPN